MEIEAKFIIPDEAAFERLLAAEKLADLIAGPVHVHQVFDRYLDTADRAFLRAGFACRIRQIDHQHLITLKSLTPATSAVHQRTELEVVVQPELAAQITHWPVSEARSFALQISDGQPLQPLFQVRQERHIRHLHAADGQREVIELSLDRVWLAGPPGLPTLGGKGAREAVTFFELEAELLPAGRMEELLTLVETLQAAWQLMPEPRSKFERGLALTHPELLNQVARRWRSDVASK